MCLFIEAIRPVLFESEMEECPYFGIGSSVLVSTRNNYYWVTARHVLDNQSATVDEIRIFPTDNSRKSIPFNCLVDITPDEEDPDFADLYILRIELNLFRTEGDQPMIAQDIEIGSVDMRRLTTGTTLTVIGFPEEFRHNDHENFEIKYRRSSYKATLAGQSPMQHCYNVNFPADHGLTTFNGLSGAPVYFMRQINNYIIPKLAGILIQGTSSSSCAHLINSEVLRSAISKSERG